MSILNVEHLTHGFGDRAILRMFHSACLRGTYRISWSQWRGKVHIYEHCDRKTDAG